jgi:uncharacterized protein (DUF427 family)
MAPLCRRPVLLAAVIASVSVVALVRRERRGAHPLLPPAPFRARGVVSINLTGFFINFGAFGQLFLFGLYLQQAQSADALQAGLLLLPMMASITIGNLLSGPISIRVGTRKPMLLGLRIAALAGLTVAVSTQDMPYVFLMLGASASVGRFLTPEPLPERLAFAEPLRRRLRVKLAGEWIADSEDVLLLHEPGRYPVAFFPLGDVRPGVLVSENRTTRHGGLGDTDWFTVSVAFAWRAMDAFYEGDERIVGHAADAYHRIDIRQSSRHLVVMDGARRIADTKRPVVLYESGFAPRWYVPRKDIEESALIPAEGQTFCPYKGLASYYDIGDHKRAAWYYPQAWPEVARISNFVSFEPDKVEVFLDGKKLALEQGQRVMPHGIDRGLDPDEILKRATAPPTPSARYFAKLATSLRCRSPHRPAAGNSRSGHFLPPADRVDQADRRRIRRSIRSRSCDRRRCGTTTGRARHTLQPAQAGSYPPTDASER